MKTKLTIFLCTLLCCWACKDNPDFQFLGHDAVYFQVSSDWEETVDSLNYTFAGKGTDVDVVYLRVNLEGNTAPRDREVRVVVDEAKTDAEAGLHYEALDDVYYLPADSVYLKLPITVYNKDNTLENRRVTLALQLEPTADLELGITERTSVRVLISNILTKPSYWDSVIKYYFGEYSRTKHELCIEQLGQDFPETSSEFYGSLTYWQVSGQYMSNYFEENYPVRDENGKIIEPW